MQYGELVILTKLKGTSVVPVDAHINLDVQRYLLRCRGVASEHKGCELYHKEDFNHSFYRSS